MHLVLPWASLMLVNKHLCAEVQRLSQKARRCLSITALPVRCISIFVKRAAHLIHLIRDVTTEAVILNMSEGFLLDEELLFGCYIMWGFGDQESMVTGLATTYRRCEPIEHDSEDHDDDGEEAAPPKGWRAISFINFDPGAKKMTPPEPFQYKVSIYHHLKSEQPVVRIINVFEWKQRRS